MARECSDHFAIIPTGQIPRSSTRPSKRFSIIVSRRFVAGIFPAGGVRGDDADHAPRHQCRHGCFQDRRKGFAGAGLARGLRQEGRSMTMTRRFRSARRSDGERPERSHRGANRGGCHAPAAALHGGDPADDNGRRGQAGRGRGTARGDERTRARNSGDAGSDHRGPDSRRVCGEGWPKSRGHTKGDSLIDQLHAAGVEVLASPEMTGQWEYKLKQMEHGHADRAAFMREIRELAGKIVERTRRYSQESQEKVAARFRCGLPTLRRARAQTNRPRDLMPHAEVQAENFQDRGWPRP